MSLMSVCCMYEMGAVPAGVIGLSPHISVNRHPHHVCVCLGSRMPSAAFSSCSHIPSPHAFSYMCFTSFTKITSGHVAAHSAVLDFYNSISGINDDVVVVVVKHENIANVCLIII